jgi:hypothetical protein
MSSIQSRLFSITGQAERYKIKNMKHDLIIDILFLSDLPRVIASWFCPRMTENEIKIVPVAL